MRGCDKPADDGYVCRRCLADHLRDLRETPWLLEELGTALARQTRYGSAGSGSSSRERPLPLDLRASAALDQYRAALQAILRALEPGREPTNNTLAHAQWLLTRAERLRFREDGPELIGAADRAFAYARYVVDAPAEKWYAGPCWTCRRDLFAKAGEVAVTCDPCGLSYDVAERRDYLLREAEDQIVNATTIARAATWLSDQALSVDRLYKWAQRGRITAKAVDRCPTHLHEADPPKCRGCQPLYRVGDALDLLATESERRDRSR